MPALNDVVPVRLAGWPTPVERAPRLAQALGLGSADLWIKRDDLTGLGAGGNKIRKLEWSIGAAVADGADVLVTSGAPQSNHARLTAAAAARLGLDAVLVLAGEPQTSGTGNLALDGLFGAQLVWAGPAASGTDPADLLVQTTEDVAARLRGRGRVPGVIPFGGSSPTSAHGYRLAAAELSEQVPDVAHVVVAVGSGGTAAGLVAGLGPERVLGVHTGAVENPRETVAVLLDGMPDVDVDASDLRLREDQVGAGYDVLAPAAAGALRTAARTEGLLLDPVYTARALAGLAAAVRDGDVCAGSPVVFVHTGGSPGFFGHPGAVALGHEDLQTFV